MSASYMIERGGATGCELKEIRGDFLSPVQQQIQEIGLNDSSNERSYGACGLTFPQFPTHNFTP